VIDALKNITSLRSGLIEDGAVGVIDMTTAVRFSAQELAEYFQLFRH
jgi:hypothetical protein